MVPSAAGKGGARRHRYVHEWSAPAVRALAADVRGLPAVREFFGALIAALRIEGRYAGRGCLLVDAHQEAVAGEEVRALLEEHHRSLVAALRAALTTARRLGQLPRGTEPSTAAELRRSSPTASTCAPAPVPRPRACTPRSAPRRRPTRGVVESASSPGGRHVTTPWARALRTAYAAGRRCS